MKLNIDDLNIKIIECNNFNSRLVGFMFRRKKIDHGLVFKKCRSIHTLFMFQCIDVVMTDSHDNILYMYENVKPLRLIWPRKGTANTYEFPLNTIKKIKESNK